MITTLKGSACVLGLAGVLAFAAPSVAAPVLSNATAVKSAVSDHAIDVRWRGGGWRGGGWHGGGVAAGVAAGVIAGAAIGAATAPGYYYGPAYGAYAYDAPVYGGPYYGPTYGSSAYYNGSYAYPHQTCGVDAGYGRWDYSQC
jgi:hypothetical protein